VKGTKMPNINEEMNKEIEQLEQNIGLPSGILPQKSRQFKKKSNSFQNSQPQALSSTIFSYPSLLTFKLSK